MMKTKSFSYILVLFLVLGLLHIMYVNTIVAAPDSFDPNQVICNNDFVVDRAVSAEEIQGLLEAADSDLSTYRDPANDRLASGIISSAIEARLINGRYRLNPRLLLVKMEVESNTVWGRFRHNLNEDLTLDGTVVGTRVDWILFYGWPDDPAGVDLSKKGFTNQVENATRILTADFADVFADGMGRNGWGVGVSKDVDGIHVTPVNAATAALYIYTPHIYPDKENIYNVWKGRIGDTGCFDDLGGVVRPGFDSNVLPANDDGSTGLVPLGFSINFFGNTFSSLYVNNNGNLTFDFPLSTYTPFPLLGTSRVIIAPYFADVDTRVGNVVTFGNGNVGGRSAFGVTWPGVGCYYQNISVLNFFQVVLIDRSDVAPGDFDIEYNYDQIEWETGQASSGDASCGGGFSARVGYSNGTDISFELPGSGIPGSFLDSNTNTGLIHNSRNSFQTGRYIFEVRSGAAPSGGTISGHIFANSVDDPVGGALVQVCGADGFCNTTTTNFIGEYSVSGLQDDSYVVTAFSPAGVDLQPETIGPFVLLGGEALTGRDIILTGPIPPPPGTIITSRGTGSDGVPIIYWLEDLALVTQGCPGGRANYEILQEDVVVRSGQMTEGLSGVYTAVIPQLYPLHGYAHVEITILCPDSTTSTIPFDIYIDPSGHVRTVAGDPISGATVTLFRSDSSSGPFLQVSNGSGIMAPENRNNPDTTDSEGRFGWNVIAGFYKVRAEKEGCVSPAYPSQSFVESGVLPVPPPVTDLDLRLDCPPINNPPVADANGPYEANEGEILVLDALGSSDPDDNIVLYEWDLDNDSEYDDATGVTTEVSFGDNGFFTVGLRVTDDFGEYDTDIAEVTVLNVPPAVEADPPTQIVQYSDPITEVTINAMDVAMDLTAVSSTTWSYDYSNFTELPAQLVLTDGGCTVTGDINTCIWTLSGLADLAPGAYTITVSVVDDDGGQTDLRIIITVLQEDARATYTGPMLVSTSCEDCTEATVPLRATIQDITAVPGDSAYDPDAGDITNATVVFVDRENSDAVLCTTDVILLDLSDTTMGTATCDWVTDIGNSDGVDFTICIVVDGYYTRSSSVDDAVVVISKPGSNFITGGGYLVNHSSAGIYAGDDGFKTNFGFNVKFNKKLTNLQGRVTVIVRKDGHVYQFKSNRLSSLVVIPFDEGDPNSGTAELFGNANIQDVTDPDNPVSIEGNATLHMVMKDNGEPGSEDNVGVTLWGQNGDLLFSSSWSGVETLSQSLDGGNLRVH